MTSRIVGLACWLAILGTSLFPQAARVDGNTRLLIPHFDSFPEDGSYLEITNGNDRAVWVQMWAFSPSGDVLGCGCARRLDGMSRRGGMDRSGKQQFGVAEAGQLAVPVHELWPDDVVAVRISANGKLAATVEEDAQEKPGNSGLVRMSDSKSVEPKLPIGVSVSGKRRFAVSWTSILGRAFDRRVDQTTLADGVGSTTIARPFLFASLI